MNVGELKANLSRVLREMRASGEKIEVCVREETVAYLAPVGASIPHSPEEIARAQLSAAGLRVQPPACSGKAPIPTVNLAGDARRDISTIEVLREEKDW